MKLWYRNLSLGSTINSFLKNVRWDDASGAAGGDAGDAGGGSGDTGADDAGKAADWRTDLDPSIKDHAVLQKYNTKNDAIKALVDVQPLIGLEKLPIPPKDASPETRDKFLSDVYDRLGRPKEAKDYKITDVKLPEGVKADPVFMDELKATAHKLGLLPHQVDGLYSWYMNTAGTRQKAATEASTKAREDSEASFRSEYGAAYDAKIAKAQSLLNKFGGDDVKQLLDKGLGNDPAVVRFMSKIADSISEDSFAKGGGESTMTPKEAEAELSKVRAQLIGMERNNPEYKLLLERRNDLMAMASPE